MESTDNSLRPSTPLRANGKYLCFTVFAAYLVLFGAAALRRPFWFDEIFTAYLAALPSASALLRALWSGADLAPPLFHLTTRFFSAFPGDPHVCLRLPALLGFGVMSACVFVFVNRRCGPMCALPAMLMPLASGFTRYSIEARPYGLVLAWFGIALVCWQSAAEGRRRRASLAGLALAVACGVSCHYYAILVLIPIGLGELVRLIRDRRPDIGVWIASAGGALALPAHLPLIRLAEPYMHNAWATPTTQKLEDTVLGIVTAPVLMCILVAAAAARRTRLQSVTRPGGLPPHEWAAAGALTLLPVLVYAIAAGWTGIFIDRYALAAMIGVAILLGFLIHAAGAKPLLVSLVLVILCIATGRNAFQLLTKPRSRGIPAVLTSRASNAPVVSGSPFVYIHMAFYAQRAGVRYVSDPVEARRRTGSDAPDIGLLALRPWAHLDVEEYSAFALRREPFLLYWRPDRFSWILPKLRASGASIELLAEEGDEQLYSVAWP